MSGEQPERHYWDNTDMLGTRWFYAECPSVPGSLVYGQSYKEVQRLLDAALAALRGKDAAT